MTDAGSVVELSGSGDEFQVWVDGTLQERIAAESFTASEDALSALTEYVEDPDRGSPPWHYASELLADGLIDVHFDLTPRGRRALGIVESLR